MPSAVMWPLTDIANSCSSTSLMLLLAAGVVAGSRRASRARVGRGVARAVCRAAGTDLNGVGASGRVLEVLAGPPGHFLEEHCVAVRISESGVLDAAADIVG